MEFISPGSDGIEVPDLANLVFEATGQIPEGMVSTYGDIARALGDVRASRVVGMILSANRRPVVIPCHRVVYSDGGIGWYGGRGHGAQRKEELLTLEGVEILDGGVRDFVGVRFSDFEIEPVLKEMMGEQRRLRENVLEVDRLEGVRTAVGLDVSYQGEMGYAAAVAYDLETGELVEEKTATSKIRFPYIPGYLSYREIPALDGLFGREDAVYMIDGHGSLHPRRFGVACHAGVYFDRPTIGVAKSLLCGRVEGNGASLPVILDGEIAGTMLRKDGKKGIYVSVGHMVSLPTCVSICKRMMRYRIPEPLRRAHALANQTRLEGTEE